MYTTTSNINGIFSIGNADFGREIGIPFVHGSDPLYHVVVYDTAEQPRDPYGKHCWILSPQGSGRHIALLVSVRPFVCLLLMLHACLGRLNGSLAEVSVLLLMSVKPACLCMSCFVLITFPICELVLFKGRFKEKRYLLHMRVKPAWFASFWLLLLSVG